MKVIVAIAMMALATASFASDRAIYDLQYLPSSGTSFGISELMVAKGRIELSDFDFDVEYKGWMVKQTLGHALTDRLLVSVEAEFAHIDTKTDFNGAKSTDTQKGLSDPTVGARFRAVDEALRIDLTGALTVKTGDKETKGHSSNNKQGGNSGRFGVEVGHKAESFQFVGIGQLNHFFKATSKDDGDKTKDDGYNEFILGGAVLVKLAESTFVKALGNVTFADEYDSDDDTTQASSTLYTTGVELQQAISKDLLVRAGMNWLNGHTSGVESYNLYTFVVGANYQF